MVSIGTLEVGATVTGASEVKSKFDGISNSFEDTAEQGEETDGILSGLGDGMDVLDSVTGAVTDGFKALSNWLGITTISGIKLGAVVSSLAAIGGKLAAGLSALVGILKGAAAVVGGVISGISATAAAVIALVAAIAVVTSELLGFTDITAISIENVKKWGSTALNVFGNLASKAIQKSIDALQGLVSYLVNTVINAFQNVGGVVVSILSGIFDTVKGIFNNMINTIIKGINGVISKINGVADAVPKINTEIQQIETGSDTTTNNNSNNDANGGGNTVKNEVGSVNVNFNEKGISNMNRREKRELAKIINDEIGGETQRQI